MRPTSDSRPSSSYLRQQEADHPDSDAAAAEQEFPVPESMAGARYLVSSIRDKSVRRRLLQTFEEVYRKRDLENLRRDAAMHGYELIEPPLENAPDPVSDDDEFADMNRRDKDGRTDAIVAAMQGNARLLRSLKGCNLNLRDKQGRTALMWAILNGHPHIVEILRDMPRIDFNLRDEQGKTAAIIAAECDRPHLFRLLHGKADLNLPDNEGNTPLIWAARHGHGNFIRAVRDLPGLDFNRKNHEEEQTAATIAARYRQADALRAMDGKADFNIPDSSGNTPAIIAAKNGDIDCILAVRDRTDFSLRSRYGQKTAVDYARERGYLDVVRAIEARPVRYTKLHSTVDRLRRMPEQLWNRRA